MSASINIALSLALNSNSLTKQVTASSLQMNFLKLPSDVSISDSEPGNRGITLARTLFTLKSDAAGGKKTLEPERWRKIKRRMVGKEIKKLQP